MELAGYSSITPIGQGGIGDVYSAVRDSTGGMVAIKVIRDLTNESSVRRRVTREVAALVQLKGHPYIVQVEEVLDTAYGPAVVMEHVPNGSLADLVKQRGRLTPGETVLACTHVATALRDAHAGGIVHRDIKPLNVLIGTIGQSKVCDFGIAALARTDTFRDRTSALSYRYASPEELDDLPTVGPPADIYSLGVTIRHLMTSSAVISTNPAEPASWIAGLDDDDDQFVAHNLWRLVVEMTAIDAKQRPTATQVVDRLERLGNELGDRRVRSLLTDAVAQSNDETVPRGRSGAPVMAASIAASSNGSLGNRSNDSGSSHSGPPLPRAHDPVTVWWSE